MKVRRASASGSATDSATGTKRPFAPESPALNCDRTAKIKKTSSMSKASNARTFKQNGDYRHSFFAEIHPRGDRRGISLRLRALGTGSTQEIDAVDRVVPNYLQLVSPASRSSFEVRKLCRGDAWASELPCRMSASARIAFSDLHRREISATAGFPEDWSATKRRQVGAGEEGRRR